MVRGKPAKISSARIGKPPVPMQRVSLYGLMEKEETAMELPGMGDQSAISIKRPADKTEDPTNKRGKPFANKEVVGKPSSLPNVEEMDQQIAMNSKRSVVDNTKEKYESKIFSLKKWMKDTYGEKEGDRPMEELDFRRFLVSGKDGKGITNANTIKTWRAAWGFWQDIDPEYDIDFDPMEAKRTKRLVKGLKYNAGDGQETDAADPVDSGRLWKMVDLLLQWNKPEYALFFVMIFYGGFRTVKTKDMKVKDCRRDTDTGTLIFTDRMKALQAKNMGKVGMKQNYKSLNQLTDFLDLCIKGKEPDDRLFEVNERIANSLMKKVAAAHHWGEGKWVVYSLRHGMSLEAGAVLEGIPDMEVVKTAVQQRNLSKCMGHTNEKSKKAYQGKKGVMKKRVMKEITRSNLAEWSWFSKKRKA